MTKSKSFKSLQDLNLIDSFLFGASTENPQNAEFIAKLIIERATGRKIKDISVMPEKQLAFILKTASRSYFYMRMEKLAETKNSRVY